MDQSPVPESLRGPRHPCRRTERTLGHRALGGTTTRIRLGATFCDGSHALTLRETSYGGHESRPMCQVHSHLSYRPRWGMSAGFLVVVLVALSLAPVASAGTI